MKLQQRCFKYSASFLYKQYNLTDPLFTYRLPQGFAEVTDNGLDTGTGATGTGRVGLNINLKYRRCAYVHVYASSSNQSFTARILIHTVVMMMMMVIIIIIIKKKQKTFPYQLKQHFFSTKLYSSPRILNTHTTSQLPRLSKPETVT